MPRIATAAVLMGACVAVSGPGAALASGCGGSLPGGRLNAVAATSPSNAWAVGSYSGGAANKTLIEHWDGTAWCQVASPSPGGSARDNELNAVAATSSSNIWAAGYFVNKAGVEQTLILHWNGTAWSQVASPDPAGPSRYNELDALFALSGSSAWAAGFYTSSAHVDLNLLLHWNGSRWRTMAIPNVRSPLSNGVDALAATSSSNLLAVGHHQNWTFTNRPIIQHWNGKAWNTQPSPSPHSATSGGYLHAAQAFSPSNAWAVGEYFDAGTAQTQIEHWNGTAWTLVTHPNPSSGQNFSFLDGIAATSPSSIWAAGSYQVSLLDRTLIEYWNGTAWSLVPSPNPGGTSTNNILMGMAATAPSDAWAVGFISSGVPQTLILHWDGNAWTQVTSP